MQPKCRVLRASFQLRVDDRHLNPVTSGLVEKAVAPITQQSEQSAKFPIGQPNELRMPVAVVLALDISIPSHC